MNEDELKDQIRKLIAEGKLGVAFDLLLMNLEDNKGIDDLTVQKARYIRVSQNLANGAISEEKVGQELNSLSSNLLSFIRNEKLVIKAKADAVEGFKETLKMSVTRVKVAEVLIRSHQANESMTIKEIENLSKVKSKSRKLLMDFLKELEKFKLIEKRKENNSTRWTLNEKGKTILEGIVSIE